MTMLDKAAESIFDAAGGDIPTLADCRYLARAALEAIREPGECIEQAMRHDDWFPSMWRDCVDAILAEK
jgi:hypothetical protein